MAYGFELRNANGAVMLTSNDITARVVAHFEVTTKTGSRAVPGATSSNAFPYLMGPGHAGAWWNNSDIWMTNGYVNWAFGSDPTGRYYIMVFRHSG